MPVVGCGWFGRRPPTLEELKSSAASARDEARDAADAERAEGAARRAEELAKQAGTRQECALPATAPVVCAEIAGLAHEARRFATRADERRRLAELGSSLRARAYRAGRGMAVRAAALPPSLRWLLAAGLASAGQSKLALIEIEGLRDEQAGYDDPLLFRALHGVILAQNGMHELAFEELDRAARDLPRAQSDLRGPELAAWIHVALAVLHWQGGREPDADRELARALQLWPNSPVAVYLTGERLAANGERERAAASLEAAAADTPSEAFALTLAVRARQLRDGSGPLEPLVFDRAFLWDTLALSLRLAAHHSHAAERIDIALAASRDLAERVLRSIPGLAEEPGRGPAEDPAQR